MKKNMGSPDRILRLIVVAALVLLNVTGTITGLWATVAIVAAVIFTLTSITGFCPIYALIGVKTCKA